MPAPEPHEARLLGRRDARLSHTNAPFRVRPALCEDLAPALLGPGGEATAFWLESTRAPPGKGAGTGGGAQTSAEM
ncbi:unnamed protein product [Rangifer tarandus platyrhynchus]|uniref:Uncharacterized protein n=1 Tax=Rangifer tarandus platyrhynchus TaxID=3082113 RepID=A0ABN8YJH5_RANTA|nr:unnamed protein product [Rangifer tarandus platyrhynchus]